MKPPSYAICTDCGCHKVRRGNFLYNNTKGGYMKVCRECQMAGPRVPPVVIETPGIKTFWQREYYEPREMV